MTQPSAPRTIQVPEIEKLILSGEVNAQPDGVCDDEREEPIPAVTIEGIGQLILIKRREMRGRNPMTGEEVLIPGKIIIKFVSDEAILEKLNRD